MNNENNEVTKQLKSIKKWIMTGALGFLLIGLGVVIFSVSMVQMIDVMENEFTEEEYGKGNAKFSRDHVSELIKQGKLDEALSLINERLETHPNDANAHWLKARSHYLKKEWNLALKHIEKTEFIAPSWEEEYTAPLKKKIEKLTK
jgi:tetratricopeptide (TPR) repeat protein